MIEQLKKCNKKIVIFGAGVVGQYILKLCHMKKVSIECFCDNKLIEGTIVDGLIVHRLENIVNKGEEYRFIIAIMDIEFIINELQEHHFYNWISVYGLYPLEAVHKECFWDAHRLENVWFAHKNYEQKKQLNLNSLDLVITERCSLKCKECSNLMQYYRDPQNFTVEQLKNEVNQLLLVCDEIYELRVIGGEPFMHPELAEILKFLSDKKQIKRVSIWTNGTIVPTEEQLQIMQQGNMWLSISDYGELSRNLRVLLEKLDAYYINYLCKDIDYWTECSTFTKWNRSGRDLKKIYGECCVRKLTTMLKGKVYICPFIANAMNLGAIPRCSQDYTDIMDEKIDVCNQLKVLLNNHNGLLSCDYCSGRPVLVKEEKKIKPYEQIKNVLAFMEETAK